MQQNISMKRRKTHIILFAVIIFTILCTCFFSLRKGVARIENDIDFAFKEAVLRDYNDRLAYMGYNRSPSQDRVVKMYAATPALDGKIKDYTLRTRSGKTSYIFKDSVDKQVAKSLLNQYIMSQLRPIKPNELNKIFQEILSKRRIMGRTGVVYSLKDSMQYSRQDTLPPASAYSTPRYTLDITGNVKVQAWVDYNLKTVISNSESVLWFICLLAIATALFYFYGKEVKQIPDGETAFEGMVIDVEKQELYINGNRCAIQKLDLTLLSLFRERAGECISREEIKQIFWSTDANANEKIDTHISSIRKILKEYPEYQLITVRGKGYYLSV